MDSPVFSIMIATRNRKRDLAVTLRNIEKYLEPELEVVVIDDGSTDGTAEYIKENFPWVSLSRNDQSRGYLVCRNKMLNETTAQYGISLDDDANFLTENPLEKIKTYFEANPQCGLIALRIFWGAQPPMYFESGELPERLRSFVGCGHVWRLQSWKMIPDYPEWFVFYGEEDFASYHLFQKGIQIHYLPSVLVHHRVEVATRKRQSDYGRRLRRSLRAGWFLLLLFYPLKKIPRLWCYSVWMQCKLKVFKGDYRALFSLFGALLDLILNLPRIIILGKRLTNEQLQQYLALPNAKIYWNPKTSTDEKLPPAST